MHPLRHYKSTMIPCGRSHGYSPPPTAHHFSLQVPSTRTSSSGTPTASFSSAPTPAIASALLPSLPTPSAPSLPRQLCSRLQHRFQRTIATLEAPPSKVWQMHFDPKVSILAVASGGSASVNLWDTSSWQIIVTLSIPRSEGPKPSDKSGSKKFVMSVAWSPDGKRLACGSMDGTISVFDLPQAKFLHHLEVHFMPVQTLVYSPYDPRLLFTASNDGNVHMYDVEGKVLVRTKSGHASWVLCVT